MDAVAVVGVVAGTVAVTGTVVGAAIKLARSVDRLVDRIDGMARDLYGEPDKPWQRGALERLTRVERKVGLAG